ncbi:MAG: hypothetical protein ACYC53_03135 [Bacillota bacterium]
MNAANNKAPQAKVLAAGLLLAPFRAWYTGRGSGRERGTTRGFAGLWLVRLPLAFFLGRHLGFGIIGVWAAMTFDLFVRYALIHPTYARRQRHFASRAAELVQ